MSELLEAALAYAKRGLPIFPCSATKEPLIPSGVLAATTDPATIRKWWGLHPRANIGLDCGGANFFVLDFDPGSSKEACAKAISGLPETGLRSKTPRGGDHWFYALSPGELAPPYTASNVKGEPKFSPHVDVRSFHSYVLLPPSRTKDGIYEWVSEQKPHHRTNEMYRIAHTGREKSATRDKWIIEADLPENIALAETWLARDAKAAVDGQGGGICAVATAAMMRSFGLSEETALDTMWRVWNPRCIPPWEEDEYEHFEKRVRNGYEYSSSDPGNMTPAYKTAKAKELFKPVSPEQARAEPYEGRFQVSTVPELEGRKPPVWLLDEVIPEKGYSILYGPPGAFKTFLALDMALSIAHWQPWHGRAVQPGRVLYCLGEGSFDVDKRIRAWLTQHECTLDPETFKVIEPAPLVKLDADVADFIKAAAHFGPWDLLVIDTIGRVMAGVDDNGALGARMFTDLATKIRLALSAATLAITHAPKDRPEVLLGSGAYEADADCIYNATIASRGDTINLRQAKIKYGAPWDKPMGFRKVAVAQSMALASCEPVKTVQAKEAEVSRGHEAQFLFCLRANNNPAPTWPDIMASMCNGVPPEKLAEHKTSLGGWFRRWVKKHPEFVTGGRGANNSLILSKEPLK